MNISTLKPLIVEMPHSKAKNLPQMTQISNITYIIVELCTKINAKIHFYVI